MNRVFQRLFFPSIAILAGITAWTKDLPPFKVQPAASYPNKQTNDQVTVAAVPYETAEKAEAAFGKLNPNQYGILPVLVVIQNDTGKSLKLDGLKVEYIWPDRTRVEATPAKDVPYLGGPNRPKVYSGPLPTGMPRISRTKNPWKGGEIDVREFSAKMLPPGQQASGFFYFQSGNRRGAKLYLTGISEATSGKEIFYFDIPLD
jgi:hypothetical protein